MSSRYPLLTASPVFWIPAFAAAFAWVEASVVVYLRDLYYPDGFAFPLQAFESSRIGIELIREIATLVMLAAIGVLAGRSRWQRFAWFAIAFGVWDILFYAWLKVMIDWPPSILDWDILFLVPLPWIGPVVAPVLISCVLIAGGVLILRTEARHPFRASALEWFAASTASAVVLWTFMQDTEAGLHARMPQPFRYDLFFFGMILYLTALLLSVKHNASHD